MKIGSELIAKAISQANAALLRIKRTLIDAFHDLRQIVLAKSERASTARKKKREGAKGKQVVSNTKAAKVKRLAVGGEVTKAKRPYTEKSKPGTAVARGCGMIMADRRKLTKGSVTQG